MACTDGMRAASAEPPLALWDAHLAQLVAEMALHDNNESDGDKLQALSYGYDAHVTELFSDDDEDKGGARCDGFTFACGGCAPTALETTVAPEASSGVITFLCRACELVPPAAAVAPIARLCANSGLLAPPELVWTGVARTQSPKELDSRQPAACGAQVLRVVGESLVNVAERACERVRNCQPEPADVLIVECINVDAFPLVPSADAYRATHD